MTKGTKIALTALVGLVGAIFLPLLAVLGLQPIRNLLWDLSYWLPPASVAPVVFGVGLLLLLGIPTALHWLIWKR